MPPPHAIKAVIFDFDGTLAVLNIDFSSMKERVFDLMSRYGIKKETIQEKYVLEVIDEVYEMLWRKSPSGAKTFYQQSHDILHEIEMGAAEKGRLIPEVAETLKGLRERGVKVGIVTRNCEEAVRKIFPNINDFCDVLVSRNSVKKVKPHPDHLAHVMKSLKISGEEAVMVGDHRIDIEAGKRVGMRTIGVLTGRTKKEEFDKEGADDVLTSVLEINKMFEED